MPEPANILIVANRTAVAERLVEAVERRAQRGPARFHLVVPATPRGLHRLVDPEVTGREEAQVQLERALPLLSAAAGSEVTGLVGDSDPVAAIHDALGAHPCDELIISTLPRRVSRWLHIDLPSKARGFGLPVTHVEAHVAPVETEARPVVAALTSSELPVLDLVASGDEDVTHELGGKEAVIDDPGRSRQSRS